MSFGKRLKAARKHKKLTQVQVSKHLGIDDTTISKYENDNSQPDNETLVKLASLYDCSIDFLLGKMDVKKGVISERLENTLNLSDDDIIESVSMYYEGFELTENEKREFIALARGFLSAKKSLK